MSNSSKIKIGKLQSILAISFLVYPEFFPSVTVTFCLCVSMPFCLYICLCVSVPLCLFVSYLSLCLFICLCVSLSLYLPLCLFVSIPVSVSLCLYIGLSGCLALSSPPPLPPSLPPSLTRPLTHGLTYTWMLSQIPSCRTRTIRKRKKEKRSRKAYILRQQLNHISLLQEAW